MSEFIGENLGQGGQNNLDKAMLRENYEKPNKSQLNCN